MEKRDLYDINRNRTNQTIFKGEETPKGKYLLAVISFIQNSKGEFLIQKRSNIKGAKYGCTGGHAKSGETSIQAMLTEIKEEIGLDVPEKELQLMFSGRDDKRQMFFDIYYLQKDFDLSNLVLQEEEVSSVSWFSVSQIKELILDNRFLESHGENFYQLLNIFKERGIYLDQ